MFRIPFNPGPAKRSSETPNKYVDDVEMADPRLLNLRDRYPHLFTTRIGKRMPRHRRGAGPLASERFGLSNKQWQTARTSVVVRHTNCV